VTSDPATRIPVSTYRLQFNRGFTFSDARRLVPYLHALGITDCYCSPLLKAVPGSPHGYDLVDPTLLNPDLGNEEEYGAFVQTLRNHAMGLILDVVPNHMGIAKSSNPWWSDVLENGPSSRYSTFFDIDWNPIKPELENKVLLPILGDLYGIVLENQEITLSHDDGRFRLGYYEHTLPVSPESSARILRHRLETLIEQAGPDDPHVAELQSIINALAHLPRSSEREPHRVAERVRESAIIRKRLAAVVRESPAVRAFLEENVTRFNGVRGEPRGFDLLDDLLNDQCYRLAFWRVASEEINYRRFFDINELAAIRMEEPAVFAECHRFIFDLIRDGAVTGLRIDHVDGLYDPGEYLRQLQAGARTVLGLEAPSARPLFVVVEKILGSGETLPETWPVHGTTGYEFLNLVNGLFVDGSQARALDEIYERFIGRRMSGEDLAYECRQLIMRVAMSSEINALAHQVNVLSERDRLSRDFTLNSLTHAIREIIACFPVYRTYIPEETEGVMERDRQYIQSAVARAKRRNPALSGLVFDFVRDLLLNRGEDQRRQDHAERLGFVKKFQQTTSPVTAKGIEDTAFYIYNRLVSLNEVGGEPTQAGVPPDVFHKRMRERRARWATGLSTTATHDTKRGEDVRTRISVLSEAPQEWKAHALRWTKLNRGHKTEVEGHPAPDRNEEYLLYQTLVGAWPPGPPDAARYGSFCERIQAYALKALQEAKVHSSWVNPNKPYEDALRRFIEAILDRSRPNPFLDDFLPFQERIGQYGLWNSLAQVVLKIAAPGIPDFYQGTELWDLSLVDPDNRRPVDFEARAGALAAFGQVSEAAGPERGRLARELLAARADGRIKLYVTMVGLTYRRAHPALFQEGEYVPLETGGYHRARLLAFTRIHRDEAVVAVVPRLLAGLGSDPLAPPTGSDVWKDTWVTVPSWRPDTRYLNLFTGELLPVRAEDDRQTLPLAEIFGEFPVALLERRA
jgi:(1->4)-alpha-D-glucan 1-alpha-D-glucosylmutase